MKGYLVLIMILFLSSGALRASDLASRICEAGTTVLGLESNWKRENKKICASAKCKNSQHEYTRSKCIRDQEKGSENTVIVVYDAWIKTANSHKSIGGIQRITINKEDQCFSACAPVKKLFGTQSGLERKSCLECFQARNSEIDENLNYPEIGRVLLKGTKCHSLCKDKEGPIQTTRTLTSECQQCVGLNGFLPEQFQYMQTKSGLCFEFDKDMKRFVVDNQLCREAKDLILTEYESAKTWKAWFTGGESHCVELDSKTWGNIYRVHTDKSNCHTSNISNAERNSDFDKASDSNIHSNSGPGSSKQ